MYRAEKSFHEVGRRPDWAFRTLLAGTLLAWLGTFAQAGLRVSAVGGVSIDADGVLSEPEPDQTEALAAARIRATQELPTDASFNQFTSERRVSLRALEAAIAEHRASQFTPLPAEVRYLGGLQQIRYLFVYPEQQDIVLVGPAEGWQYDEWGHAVGKTTGKPVLQLDDLLVALRAVRNSQGAPIQCSIDPTPEGIKRVRQLFERTGKGADPRVYAREMERVLGPQRISIGGVPDNSHFARVLVAADYRMKQLAMDLEEAPIANFPSYLEMAAASRGRSSSALPRWWLAARAEPLLRDNAGLAWELRGIGVECLAEEDFIQDDGQRTQRGKVSRDVRQWAETFSRRFDELAAHDTVFGQLRNLIDVAVVAALMEREQLMQQASFAPRYLMADEPCDTFNVPRSVDSRASFVRQSRGWLVSASGGVQFMPSQIVDSQVREDELQDRRTPLSVGDGWWWNVASSDSP